VIEIGAYHVAFIVLAHPQSINSHLFAIFVSYVDCQFDGFAILLRGFLKLEIITENSSHIHTAESGEAEHAHPARIIFDVSMNDCEEAKVELISFVKINLIADVEE
jgi:hypothetical protein